MVRKTNAAVAYVKGHKLGLEKNVAEDLHGLAGIRL
jgi:hypothetical protein